ncbi:MAG: MFS transporter [Dysgonamonadaceae bacterium]|jgi:fucose permease|nr:MFS transporter [Dysgonamonadaceae bacterium]
MNTKSNTSLSRVLPVIFGFFIMGFVDLIGTAINYVKADFALNDSMANLLSLSCFFWFLVLSIPVGFLMNRIGRKNAVLVSFLFTFAGLLLPWMVYNFTAILFAFALIGIGNTLIQVALNPLVTDVVSKEKQTGMLTLGQFVKAISSCLGPVVASWLAGTLFGWKYVFPIFALVSILAAVWLWLTRIEEAGERSRKISFRATLSLLKNRNIRFFFIAILVLVGVDVGLNATLPKYLGERCQLPLEKADLLKSIYFIVRTIGAFVGGILLMKISEKRFYKYSSCLALAGIACVLMCHSLGSIIACVVVFGLGYANLFAIVFSLALKQIPEKANEISSLLIVGVSGGVIALLLGIVSDLFQSQWAAMAILAVICLYLVALIRTVNRT